MLKSEFAGAEIEKKSFRGKVGVGTWSTSAEFDNVKIVNNNTGEVLAQDDFSEDNFREKFPHLSQKSSAHNN